MIISALIKRVVLATLIVVPCLNLSAQDLESTVNQAVNALAKEGLNCYQLRFSYYSNGEKDPGEQKLATYCLEQDFESIYFEFEEQTSFYSSAGLLQVDRTEQIIAYQADAPLQKFGVLSSMDSLRALSSSVTELEDFRATGKTIVYSLNTPKTPFSELIFHLNDDLTLKEIIMVYKGTQSGPMPDIEGRSRMTINFEKLDSQVETISSKMKLSRYLTSKSSGLIPTKEFADYELLLL